MAFFNEFPHSRTYDADLGWLIWAMKKLIGEMEEFTEINSIKFGDPLNWSISTQYEPTTIVVDNYGNGYISRKAVPAGIPLSNTEYWTQIFNFSEITDTIRTNIAVNAEESPTTPIALEENDLVWWNDELYQVLYDIAAGTAFIPNVNIKKVSVDDKINDLYNKTVPYPIYYPSQELAVFGGSIGSGEIVEASGDVHYYDPDTNTMTIVHS